MFSGKQTQSKLDKVSKQLSDLKKEFSDDSSTQEIRKEMGDHFKTIGERLEALESDGSAFDDFNARLKDIEKLTRQFEKRVNGLTSFEKVLTRQLVDQTQRNLNKKLEFLESLLSRYKELDNGLKDVSKETSRARKEIGKFTEIAQHIKASDFEMQKNVKELSHRDAEIRRLEKENDKLKTIIARRRQR